MPRLYFEESPIIAAVKTAEELKTALSSDVEIVFLLHATLSTLSRRMESAREAGKRLFIHMDLVTNHTTDIFRFCFAVVFCLSGHIFREE